MQAHIHISVVNLLQAFAGVIALGTIWRLIAYLNNDNDIGKAMLFVY